MTELQKVRAIARHLKKMPDDDLQVFIEDASAEVNKYKVGSTDRERLTRWLAAHLATLNYRRAQSESVAELSRSFSSAQGEGLDATEYGQEYKRQLKKVIGPHALNVVVI